MGNWSADGAGREKMGGDHRVFWCSRVERPIRNMREGERTWTSWVEVEEWARAKECGDSVERFFEAIGG